MRHQLISVLTASALGFLVIPTAVAESTVCTTTQQPGTIPCYCYVCGPDPIGETTYYAFTGDNTDEEACKACGKAQDFDCFTNNQDPCSSLDRKDKNI